MSHGGVRFVGGPADGREQVLPVGPDGSPPTIVSFFGLARPSILGTRIEPLRVEYHYRREVSPDDNGPLWLYRYTEPATASEETP